ncbi:MAG: VCBS repeat-containing protein [Flavobacteriales bacterium]|nr:VCBS repeat-containing protein [Flavobacteriales bacterium]
MKGLFSLVVVFCLALSTAWAQPTFNNMSSLLPQFSYSGGCAAVVDMNGDGLDDICRLDSSRHVYVEYQNADGSFTRFDYGRISNSSQWGWAIGDTDHDGHKDIFSGGSYDNVRHMQISAPGVFNLVVIPNSQQFMQCANMADVNNDGHVDGFGCHDDGPSRIYLNNGSGTLGYNNYIDFTTTPSSDMSGNYGSTWTDFDNDGDLDLYIAKCRQGVTNQNDPRRINVLYVNDGSNNYTEMADTYGVRIQYQSWSCDFGDIDNDGDMDLVVTNHDNTIMLLQNDGTGHFTEITAGSGLLYNGFFLQSIFRDFDNDGYLDLITAGGVNTDKYFKGNGDGTFTPMPNVFPSTKPMHTFAIGDLNNDGFEDVFAGYGDQNSYVTPDYSFPDRLWLNTPNGNHWFNVNLVGTTSNHNAIGARTQIYGPWGVQIREVRSGESYGIVNSFTQHYGLGQFTEVDSLMIRWPSGLVEWYYDLDGDQSITVIEGNCIAPDAQVLSSGGQIYCTGGAPITLTANAGYQYTWSTGATTQSINVTAGGAYTVTIDDGTGCVDNATLIITQDPDETPTISFTGETTFCEGGSVVLNASAASGYLWNTGETTQSILATDDGPYTVATSGVCGLTTSAPVSFTVLASPAAPTAPGEFLPGPGTADLTATGDSIVWYDQASGGTPVGYGNAWTTPFVNTTTSFWCEDVLQYGGTEYFGGKVDNSTSNGQYHNNNTNYLVFEVYEPMVLRSVKVYANGAGARSIAVVQMGSGATVASGTFNVPDGESRVQLDFDVAVGGPYGLRVTSSNPQLWRDGTGSNPAYPYTLGTLGTITQSNATGANALNFYYYFYDWEVEEPSFHCSSPRTEVVVDVAVGVVEADQQDGVSVWPNPTTDVLNVATSSALVDVTIVDITGRVVMVRSGDARQSAAGQFTLDLGHLAPGEYLLRTRTENGQTAHRVMVR